MSLGLAACDKGAPSLEIAKTVNISSKLTSICSRARRVFVEDVSQDGAVVVGMCGTIDSPDSRQAYVYSESTGAELFNSVPNSVINEIHVSGDGSVILGTLYFKNEATHLFRYTRSTGLRDLGAFGDKSISVKAVSADGSVVAGSFRNSSTQYPLIYHAYKYSEAHGFENLGPLSTESTHPRGLSADGSWITGNIDVGTSSDKAVRLISTHAFRYSRSSGIEDFDVTGWGERVFPSAISNDGRVFVGQVDFHIAFAFVSFFENSHLFIHTEKHGMEKLTGISADRATIMKLSGDGTMVAGSFLDSRQQSNIYVAKLVRH